jgi:hypothetical protein
MVVCASGQNEYFGEPYKKGPYTLEDKYNEYLEKADDLQATSLDRWVGFMLEECSKDSMVTSVIGYLSTKEEAYRILITHPEYLINTLSVSELSEILKSMDDSLTFDEKIMKLKVSISFRALQEAVKCREFILEMEKELNK